MEEAEEQSGVQLTVQLKPHTGSLLNTSAPVDQRDGAMPEGERDPQRQARRP